MNATSDAPEPVLLIIADISGYTRYMTANAKTLAHSQTIITELVKAIVKQVELPIEVAKLEGDAVFLFCRKNNPQAWPQTKRVIGEKLLTFFRMFGAKVAELSQSTACSCKACMHIDKLRLKIVVHSGEALFHHVLNFLELAGVDVIIAHRLLKNSVAAEQYLLLTDAARHDVEFAEQIKLAGGSETYDDIGRVNTLVYLPDAPLTPSLSPSDGERVAKPGEGSAVRVEQKSKSTFAARFGKSWKLFLKLLLAPLLPKPPQDSFHHVTASTGAAGRIGLALLTLLLLPLLLLVGTIPVLFRALKQPA